MTILVSNIWTKSIVHEQRLIIDWNEEIKQYVRGFMIESYLEDGRQNEPEVFGKSITDPCLGWDNTESSSEKSTKR